MKQLGPIDTIEPNASELLKFESGKLHISGLDPLRTAAALIVVVSHFAHRDAAALGVELFFVLSGYLITTILIREHEKAGKVSLTNFYRRRAKRILPAYYVSWLINIGAFTIVGHRPSLGQLLATAGYYTNYYQTLINPSNGFMVYSWSLAVEEQFYLLWPFLFSKLAANPRTLARCVSGLIAASVLWRYIFLSHSTDHWYVYNAFECRADQLLIGCLTALAIQHGWVPRFFSAICASELLVIPTIALLSGSFIFLVNSFLGPIADAGLAAVLLIQLIFFTSRRSMWSWLECSASWSGAKISYAAYLYHTVVHNGVTWALPWTSRLVTGFVSGVAVLGFAQGSYQFVEKRFLKPNPRTERAEL